MLGEDVDTLGEDRDLDLGGAGVGPRSRPSSDLYAALCVSTFQKILRELRPGSGEILRGTKSRNCAQIHVLNKFTIGMCGCKEKNAKNSLFL